MLYLSRKVGESIVIDERVEITVVEVRGKTVKLGCRFPQGVSVLRRELSDRTKPEPAPTPAPGPPGRDSDQG